MVKTPEELKTEIETNDQKCVDRVGTLTMANVLILALMVWGFVYMNSRLDKLERVASPKSTVQIFRLPAVPVNDLFLDPKDPSINFDHSGWHKANDFENPIRNNVFLKGSDYWDNLNSVLNTNDFPNYQNYNSQYP